MGAKVWASSAGGLLTLGGGVFLTRPLGVLAISLGLLILGLVAANSWPCRDVLFGRLGRKKPGVLILLFVIAGGLIGGIGGAISLRLYRAEQHEHARLAEEKAEQARRAAEQERRDAEQKRFAQERKAKIARVIERLTTALGATEGLDYKFRDVKKAEDWTWELVKKFEKEIQDIQVPLTKFLEQELPGSGAHALIHSAVGVGGQTPQWYEYTRLHSFQNQIRSILQQAEYFVDRAS